ncbi:hypothetical protein SPBRAN_1224 [uncultured Candidatus Thioglobus sp.]|nr:hypothetical protein SPBRAN_1224 [uncultured Candidatus Thioglobus sp.]
MQYADILPVQFIIVEDSGDEKVRDALEDLGFAFEFIINHLKLGQAAAIDAGYAKVKTPHVFHCEDDWLFFRSGFIRDSFFLLDKFPKASTILLRGREEGKVLMNLPYEIHNGIMFFRTYPEIHKLFFGYSYNPGLRRLSDYRHIAPIADIGDEGMVSFVFKQLGFYSVHLEIPAVVHLGGKQSTQMRRPKSFFAYLPYKIKKIRNQWQKRKWRILGLPKQWTDKE